ncbi:hypothetical protein CC85DRAFT_287174 [Cutaneotrichosporon oleaginosum]|uniref:Uncharacterized protein n=1 Tax=Cutaneotrichosporon oleaginosum TaxID=879819 RepID=A0A0J0XI05_9TREE|nr:uncharacterized protein CC85DRAFT_287174 [Cutaneotrichosporon oleaginosum]KLT40760.1 hypothetical protein CC85DRAFT_287174 [Cutaneotrichosporon oleaginosum]TXT06784.1 hypothetical protein COLE_06115 [Cutaneotrichosporon oleaginosum]
MPYISTEALIGAALVVFLAFGYQHLTSTTSVANSNDAAAKKKNKKHKKKKTGQDGSADTPATVSEAEESKPGPKKGRKGKHSAPLKQEVKQDVRLSPGSVSAPAPQTPEVPAETPSFAAAAGGSPASVPRPKPKTLAEKLVPKPRKTKVDDMLEPEDRPPQLARVMRVVQPEKVERFAEDYASSDWSDEPRSQDDGWNVVAAKKKPVSVSIAGGGGGNGSPSRASSNDPLTKVQRKNQKKAEMKRVAKEAEEADRLRRLAAHKRDLEREKINSIYNASQKKVVRERGRIVDGGSGGQAASLNNKGQLVWD